MIGIDISEAIRARIYALCGQRGISPNKLANLCGITPSTISNITSGRNHSTTVATIKKLCDGLDITLGEFFSTPEFDALEQEIR